MEVFIKKYFNIGIHRYKIKITDNIPKGFIGICDRDKREILVLPGGKRNDQIINLLHETVHAIIDAYGINQIISEHAEEVICEAIAKELFRNFTKIGKEYF